MIAKIQTIQAKKQKKAYRRGDYLNIFAYSGQNPNYTPIDENPFRFLHKQRGIPCISEGVLS